jgi:hypothetical protein
MKPSRPSQPRSRWIIWVGRVLLWGLLILGPAILWQWSVLERSSRVGFEELDKARAETDAQDPRWRWEQIDEDRPDVPEERNSLRITARLETVLKAHPLPSDSNQFDDEDFPGNLPANRLLPEAAVAHLEHALAGQEEAIALARSLRKYPRGRYALQLKPDVLSTLLPHVQPCRETTWVLDLDSERQLHEGHAHTAAEGIHATLHAGAGLRGEPMAVSQLVRIAIRAVAVRRLERVLGMSELDEKTLADLQEHLAAEAAENLALDAMRGERAAINHLFDNLHARKFNVTDFLESASDGGKGSSGWWGRLNGSLYSYSVPADHAEFLRWMNRIVELARQPPEEQPAEWDALDQELRAARINGGSGHSVLTLLFLPGFQKIGATGLRDTASLRCATVALATERFRRAKQRWPESLAELVPGYLPAVPVDPYSGKPLLYKRFDDGVAIYSVGKNGVDDGGLVLAGKDFLRENADLGLRLWDTPHRRLPPLPRPVEKAEPEAPLHEVAP